MNQPEPVTSPPKALIAVLALAGITVSLQQTFVIPLLPHLPALLHTTRGNASWAVTATLIAGAVSIPIVGRLADMWGKRRILLSCLAFLVTGSAVTAFSTSLGWFVAGRALQGTAAGVVSLGISLLRDHLPPHRLASATSVMSTSLGVGASLGIPLSALLAQYADWRVLFWTAGGLATVAGVLVLLVVPRTSRPPGGRFDPLGALLLSSALVCLFLAVSQGGTRGWTGGLTLGSFAAAATLLVLFGAWELRTAQPLIDLRVSRRPQVLLTNTASLVFGFSMLTSSLVFTQLLQMPTTTGYGFGESMLVAGLLQAPGGVCMIAMSPVSAKITVRSGPRTTLMAGASVVLCGYGFATLSHTQLWQLLVCSALVGSGIGLAYGAMPSLIMSAVPVSQTAAANSLNNLCRSLGTTTASAVAGLLLATMTTTVSGHVVPDRTAFTTILLTGAAAALLALVIAAVIPSRRPATTADLPLAAATAVVRHEPSTAHCPP
ncbi:MFS transporter [Kibdelosporangium persicum]|uniref:Major facilitator transporter n=1 Tax=Kibdelosporangium persicum TaxID=2698649 RepID=A0ABX2F960_9PSEU|nr:MFS transporter [Kibdelosporangium persicum]NRN67363.1 Major facilitator transporter [Kibdelosporangium persicum]